MTDTYTSIVAYSGFVFGVITMSNQNLDIASWYNREKRHVSGWTPPSWVFPVVWTLLYGLLIAAGVVIAHTPATFALYFVNLFLNVVWMRTFFGGHLFSVALLVLLSTLGVTVALLVLLGLYAQYVAMGLVLPYAAWLCVALYLNYQFIYNYSSPEAAGGRRARIVSPKYALHRGNQ